MTSTLEIETTPLEGCFILKPKVFEDHRGSFMESFNTRVFAERTSIVPEFVQENQSVSKKGVLRGFHFQKGEHAQAKLVRVVKGEVQDVVIDLRKDSDTFGDSFAIVLNDRNQYQLYVPKGFAHAFLCLSETVIFSYKCDAYYNKASESGILYGDPELRISWKLPDEQIIVSEKDKNLPTFKALFS